MIRIIVSQPTIIPEQPVSDAILLANGTFILMVNGNYLEKAA